LRAVLADAREVGLLDEEAAADLSGCIASPAAAPMLGMIVPSLRAAVDEARGARQRMAETPVDQRGAVIAEMAAELRAMDAEDRDEAIAALDNPKSPFPGWLRDGVKAAVR
jgi:acyl-CoA reductase-like NAD-dependent aldehyde dehydrogenase